MISANSSSKLIVPTAFTVKIFSPLVICGETPAAWITVFIFPCSAAYAASFFTASLSPASHGNASASIPSSFNSAIAFSSLETVLPTRIIFCSFPTILAASNPIPLPPPVTTHTFFILQYTPVCFL